MMAAELGQQSVEFSALVRKAAEESFLALKDLVDRSKSVNQVDSDKKIDLLKYILKTRQRMLRLHVLAKWCQQVPLVQYCQQLASTLSSHDTCFTQAADSLFFMHEGLQQARAPMYDVPSAIEVLLTGGYQRLPKCIEDLGYSGTLSEKQQKPTLRKLDMLLQSKLLEAVLPKEISQVKVSNGMVLIQVDGEFEVHLTLGYRGHLSLWRILHLKLLVGEKTGYVKLEETRRFVLGDDLERRMSAVENPFTILYSVLHEFSIALVMDTVIRQVQGLRLGRWKDAIRFELISDGGPGQGGNASTMQCGQDGEPDSGNLKTPGVKINYWLDFDKNSGGSDHIACPFLKIESGPDLQIQCIHNTFLLDPFSDKEAVFSIEQSCIDVEKLLLKAIVCNRHTRLLEIHRELHKNAQIFQAAGDVVLEHHGVQTDIDENEKVCDSDVEYRGDEVLQVRAYGLVYMTLGISIRTGLFSLNCSKNIFEQSVLADYEEILNQRSMAASEVFISLRIKSMLHLFASMGRFLGLQVYEQGLTMLEIPKFMLTGSDLLLMGFPHCGSSYYLMMQLDEEFKPLFKLLETQPDPAGGLNSVGEGNHIIRINNIDIANMELVEDEMNLSLIMWEKLSSSPINDDDDSIQSCGRDLPLDLSSKPRLQHSGCPQPSFSSVVDEVFEFEKGSSATPLSIHSKPVNSSPHKYMCSAQGVKIGVGSPKQERGLPYAQITHGEKASCGGYASSGCLYQSNIANGLLQNSTLLSSQPLRGSSPAQNIAQSKSDQNLSSFRSPSNLVESNYSSGMKDSQARLLIESSNDSHYAIVGSHSSRMHMISPQLHESQTLAASSKHDQTSSSLISNASGHHTVAKQNKSPRKRTLSDMLSLIPSLNESSYGIHKRRKISSTASCYPIISQTPISLEAKKKKRCTYGSLLADSNCEVAPNIYLTFLLHVIRHCSLCIKHAQLTSQMDALEIPFVEEVGLQCPSSNLWFRLPFVRDDSWQHICLRLGKSGSMCWDVKVNDPYFKELWELQKGSTNTPWGSGVHIANASDVDSHIRYDPEGVVLTYSTVEFDSIEKLVSDLQRIFNARLFACGMRNLLTVKANEMLEDGVPEDKTNISRKRHGDSNDKMSEQIRRVFKIDAVGLMSLWFCYGPVPVITHFVVEWESGKNGCTMHVSPDQLWPHTKFLEDFINGAEVASFLDCVRLTAGPLLSLGSAIRPARVPPPVASILSPSLKQNGIAQSQGMLPNASSNNIIQHASSGSAVSGVASPLGPHSIHSAAMLSSAGRGGPGIVPSSLLPIDVSVVLRGPYWIRIIYRKKFAVDMRCFAGDQVWLQPATPPKGGPAAGGSLPCPQFRPFIMEHVAQGLNALETSFTGNLHTGGLMSSSNANTTSAVVQAVANGSRASVAASVGTSRPGSAIVSQGSGGLSRVGNAMLASSSLASMSGLPSRISPSAGVPVHVKGELNTAFIGLGDDGGYGGGWVPLAALKKVLRGILKYLGVLWLFAQLPELLKDILGSILKENEGALLNLDQEQPALRFFIGGYVFAVSVHRVQLLLQVLSVKRFHHQQQQQQQTQSNTQEELVSNEISEICDYFSRRVASEPYDASRVASFITLLTLPISALREFLKLTSWEKGLSQVQTGDVGPAQRARVELCLENHSGMVLDESAENSSLSKSNIHHNRAQNSVEFSLNFVLDSTLIPHVNAAGGAAWLPHCVSVRLKFSFGENIHISLVRIDGSHGGKACWSRPEEWDKCKQRIARAVDVGNANSSGDIGQGRIKVVAENVQRTLQSFLQQVRDASVSSSASAP